MKEVDKLDTNYDTVLIIGNGFDINLGLKTHYNDFMESKFFQSLIDDKNDLAYHLQREKNLKNWIDIENELKRYSRITHSESKVFSEEFKKLSKQLRKYLLQVDLHNLKDNSNAFKLLEALSRKKVLILNFNYTQSIDTVLKTNYRIINSNSFHKIQVHGSIYKDNIIIGVEDSAKTEHIFLKKSVNDGFSVVDFRHTLLNTRNIIFFGHALGETDHSYFNDFFYKAAMFTKSSKKRNIVIFHHGDEDQSKFYKQLNKLTLDKIGDLRKSNNFNTLDSSKPHCIEELQDWLPPVEDRRYMTVI